MDNEEPKKLQFNFFPEVPTIEPSVSDARLLLVGKLTALPEGTSLRVSQETYIALQNLLNLLSIERASKNYVSLDTGELLADAALGSRISLLEEILVTVTVE